MQRQICMCSGKLVKVPLSHCRPQRDACVQQNQRLVIPCDLQTRRTGQQYRHSKFTTWNRARERGVYLLALCVCVCVRVCVCVCLSACLSICLSVCLSACLSICLSVCLSICCGPFRTHLFRKRLLGVWRPWNAGRAANDRHAIHGGSLENEQVVNASTVPVCIHMPT